MRKFIAVVLIAALFLLTATPGPSTTQVNLATQVKGILPCADMPALTGDVTTSSGACATALGTVAISKGGTNQTSASFATVTDGSPISWSLGSALYANGVVTLSHSTATRALNVSNLVNGGQYILILKQDSTGGAALTFGTGCGWKVGGGGSGAVTLSSAANAIDMLAFVYDGTNCYVNFNANFN